MLLDGNSLAFRAFYALPAENFKTQGGLTTNAVYGFTAMLINLLRDEGPTHIAAAFDVSRQTFRLEKYPEYKAGRSATPDEFRGQIDITKEVLAALGITVLAEAGFEADDLIATLATQAEAEGYRVLVVTGDRDSLQLVSDDVTVLYPRKGVSELTRFTPEAVQEKYGLTPRQYPDFAALRGDPSDNLPGIPGVGEKTATKWIAEYGSLQALVDNIDKVKGKVGDALRAHISSVLLNRELTDLIKDVPLPQTPDTLRMQPWNRDQIHRLFDDLEFRVLRDRLFDTLASADPEVDEGFDVRGAALEPGTLSAWLTQHSGGERFGVAVVGTHLAFDGDATALALVAGDGEGIYIDTATLTPEDEQALAAWLADPGAPKALHEAKLAMHDLEGRGWRLAGVTSDTALAAYLVRPGQRSFALDDLSVRYLRRELRADTPAQQQLSLLDDPDGGVDDQAVQTLILRANAVADLAGALDEELARIDSSALLGDMELPVQRVLAELESNGIAVDLKLLSELQSEFADQIRDAAEAAYAVIGKQINLGSPKQLQTVLFDELEMPKTKRTKTGYTTDADALQSLFDKTGHPFLQHMLTHRDVTRLKVTVDGLLNAVA
ncbi:MAG: polymerase, partial [Mycobacterium sp.]|nr:polymerase [Mycobacterium sp.]